MTQARPPRHIRLRRALATASGIVSLGALLASLAGGPAAQIPQIEAQPIELPEAGPLVPPGPQPDLVLLYTGGVAGYVEPCG